MLVGAYPFEDPEDPRNFRKTIRRIVSVQYSIPDNMRVSANCRHLLSHIFVANPAKRITIAEIKTHPFLKNMPKDRVEGEKTNYENANRDLSLQSVDEINQIIEDAKVPEEGSTTIDEQRKIVRSIDPED